MKIVFYLKEEGEVAYLRECMPNETLEFRRGEITEPSDATVLSIFMDHRIDKETLERFVNLKLIVTRSTGYDHIDLAAANARGVVVANVPNYGQHTVAEFAVALMLALSRRVVSAQARLAREGVYIQQGLEGFDLFGKTLGIVGTGRIGAHVARIAHGLGMTILAHDQFQNEALVEQYQVTYVALPELFKAADIISLHVPNTQETHHLCDASAFAMMKRGVCLINTARGAVVDTQALIEALDQGVLAGAALDVQEDETASPQTLALARRENVILTPHIAFDTREAKLRILDATIENIRAFQKGSPTNVVGGES